MKQIILILMLLISSILYSQSAGDFRSKQSGAWNLQTSWERFDGTTWTNAATSPTSIDGVITIRNGHTITITGTVTIDQVIVESGGQVTVNSLVTHTLNNGSGTDLVIYGTWLNSGGTWTINSGATWQVANGGTFIHSTTSGISTPLGAAILDNNSNFIYRGSGTLTPAVSMSGRTYGNLTFESTSGSWSTNISGTGTLNVNGDFIIGSGVTYLTAQTGVMTFAGNFTNNGTLTNHNGTQTYTFTGVDKTISGSGAIEFETFNISIGASINLAKNVTIASGFTATVSGTLNTGNYTFGGDGSFTLNSGATLKSGHSNGLNGNITVTGTKTFSTSANYEFNGSSAQVTGSNLPSTINNLIINNAAGVTLSGNTSLTGNLTLLNGVLNLSDKNLTLSTTSTVSGTPSSSNMVNVSGSGKLVKTFDAGNQTFLYPVGDASKYTPVNLSFNSASVYGTVGVTLSNTKHPNNNSSTDFINRYWTLSQTGFTSPDYNVTFYYDSDDIIGTESNLYGGKFNGTSWTLLSQVNTGNNSFNGTNLTSFSDFTAGEQDDMPVELTKFVASVNKNDVTLNWTTATETQNAGWEIERRAFKKSENKPADWQKIGFVDGARNSNAPKSYTFTDKNVPFGQYEYRLRQIDLDGSVDYSEVILVSVGAKPTEFALYENYPNPFNPTTKIRYAVPHSGKITLAVYNSVGQLVSTLVDEYTEAGIYEKEFDGRGLSSGVYMYVLSGENVKIVKKMLLVK